MSINRFDPFRELAVLQDRVNRLFNQPAAGRDSDDLMSPGNWRPAVDIYEVEGALVLKAELPDMRREDVEVNLEKNTLTIRGERKLDPGVKQEKFHRVERVFGTFVRQFSLPSTVDSARIAAEYKNGVLTVTLPVREEAKPRAINIEVAA